MPLRRSVKGDRMLDTGLAPFRRLYFSADSDHRLTERRPRLSAAERSETCGKALDALRSDPRLGRWTWYINSWVTAQVNLKNLNNAYAYDGIDNNHVVPLAGRTALFSIISQF
jgi:hypothetical protein